MDTSIRLYNTNSSLRSVMDAEHKGRTTAPLAAEEDVCEEAPTIESENAAETLSAQVGAVPQEQVDVADFEAIFLRFQTPLTSFIYHLIGNREQAYDLTQDVFVKAYKALLAGTIVQSGALSAWLYRIAANTTTDALRRRRLIAWLPLSLFHEDRGIGAGILSDGSASDSFNASSEDGSERSKELPAINRGTTISTMYERNGYDGGRFENSVADREIVKRVFEQLPPKYAICLWLYETDGLSCAEIAQVLNISASAVKMRLMRARERFITLYKQEVGEE
jgi:RNA polymerase sigma-70 factor, ECF subfamily